MKTIRISDDELDMLAEEYTSMNFSAAFGTFENFLSMRKLACDIQFRCVGRPWYLQCEEAGNRMPAGVLY